MSGTARIPTVSVRRDPTSAGAAALLREVAAAKSGRLPVLH